MRPCVQNKRKQKHADGFCFLFLFSTFTFHFTLVKPWRPPPFFPRVRLVTHGGVFFVSLRDFLTHLRAFLIATFSAKLSNLIQFCYLSLLLLQNPTSNPHKKTLKEPRHLPKWPSKRRALTPPFKSACLLPQPPIHTPHALPLPCNITTATFLGRFLSPVCGSCRAFVRDSCPRPPNVPHQILPSTQASRHILLGLHPDSLPL